MLDTSPASAATDNELDRAPSALIRRLSRRLRYRLDARLAPHGLTAVKWGVISSLALDDGQCQAWLQQRLAIEAATLTPIVQRLERDGWIRRASDAADRRRQRVWLTSRSRDLLGDLNDQVEHYRRESLSCFSDDEVDTLSALLARMEAGLL